MKLVYAIVLWLLLWTIFIPSCGKKVDKICVRGKVARDQVIAIQGHPGQVLVKPGDRIVLGYCSELMRKITFRNEYEAILDRFSAYGL